MSNPETNKRIRGNRKPKNVNLASMISSETPWVGANVEGGK